MGEHIPMSWNTADPSPVLPWVSSSQPTDSQDAEVVYSQRSDILCEEESKGSETGEVDDTTNELSKRRRLSESARLQNSGPASPPQDGATSDRGVRQGQRDTAQEIRDLQEQLERLKVQLTQKEMRCPRVLPRKFLDPVWVRPKEYGRTPCSEARDGDGLCVLCGDSHEAVLLYNFRMILYGQTSRKKQEAKWGLGCGSAYVEDFLKLAVDGGGIFEGHNYVGGLWQMVAARRGIATPPDLALIWSSPHIRGIRGMSAKDVGKVRLAIEGGILDLDFRCNFPAMCLGSFFRDKNVPRAAHNLTAMAAIVTSARTANRQRKVVAQVCVSAQPTPPSIPLCSGCLSLPSTFFLFRCPPDRAHHF